MVKISDIKITKSLLDSFSGKNTVTNNFLLLDSYERFITQGSLFFITTGSNLFFIIERNDYYQVYYHINDLKDHFNAAFNKPSMMEILYRGEKNRPDDIIGFWEYSGFKQHLTRNMMMSTFAQLTLPEKKENEVVIKYADTASESLFTKKLIEDTFDKYTGEILTIEEIDAFISKGNVICAYWRGMLCGILQFDVRNNVVWIGHIAVDPEFRGRGIASELVRSYIDENVKQPGTRYQLWVLQNNPGAIALYEKFGFKFGNKSSASMLKL